MGTKKTHPSSKLWLSLCFWLFRNPFVNFSGPFVRWLSLRAGEQACHTNMRTWSGSLSSHWKTRCVHLHDFTGPRFTPWATSWLLKLNFPHYPAMPCLSTRWFESHIQTHSSPWEIRAWVGLLRTSANTSQLLGPKARGCYPFNDRRKGCSGADRQEAECPRSEEQRSQGMSA